MLSRLSTYFDLTFDRYDLCYPDDLPDSYDWAGQGRASNQIKGHRYLWTNVGRHFRIPFEFKTHEIDNIISARRATIITFNIQNWVFRSP